MESERNFPGGSSPIQFPSSYSEDAELRISFSILAQLVGAQGEAALMYIVVEADSYAILDHGPYVSLFVLQTRPSNSFEILSFKKI